jgi:hypothetical protein
MGAKEKPVRALAKLWVPARDRGPPRDGRRSLPGSSLRAVRAESKNRWRRRLFRFQSKRTGTLYVSLSPHAQPRNHWLELGHPGDRSDREPSRVALSVLSFVEYSVGKCPLCGVEVVSCEAARPQKNLPCVVKRMCVYAAIIRVENAVHAFHGEVSQP